VADLNPDNAIEMRDITKTFGDVSANRHINIAVRWGEVLSLLGKTAAAKRRS
jgi:ABC-type uncharacterized transport system ATPase subunit